MPSAKKTEQLKGTLEDSLSEAQRVLASAAEETRAYAAKHADSLIKRRRSTRGKPSPIKPLLPSNRSRV